MLFTYLSNHYHQYAKEEAKLFKDFRHGIVFGTQTFFDTIRKRFFPDTPHNDLPA